MGDADRWIRGRRRRCGLKLPRPDDGRRKLFRTFGRGSLPRDVNL